MAQPPLRPLEPGQCSECGGFIPCRCIEVEAEWVTDMRRHFEEHGFYRQADLNRLLGEPGSCATLDENGNVVLRRPSHSGDKFRQAMEMRAKGRPKD